MISRREAEENTAKARKMPTEATFKYTENTIRERSLKGAPFAQQEIYLPTAPALKDFLEQKDFQVMYYSKDPESSYAHFFIFWDKITFYHHTAWAKAQNFPVLNYTGQIFDELTRNT
jgi:hypothetical protein